MNYRRNETSSRLRLEEGWGGNGTEKGHRRRVGMSPQDSVHLEHARIDRSFVHKHQLVLTGIRLVDGGVTLFGVRIRFSILDCHLVEGVWYIYDWDTGSFILI